MKKTRQYFKKKTIIITTSILLGVTIIGGTALYSYKTSQHNDLVATAQEEIKIEQQSLESIYNYELIAFETKDGYLVKGLTKEKLDSLGDSLQSIKDSAVDFSSAEDTLAKKIKNVSADKQQQQEELSRIEVKLAVQNAVNSLFTESAIIGEDVSNMAIKEDVSNEEINGAKKLLKEKISEESDWYGDLLQLVDDAYSQVEQINKAKKSIQASFDGENVIYDVTRSDYNAAKEEVAKVRNESIKKSFEDKLEQILEKVSTNENLAKAKEKETETSSSTTEQSIAAASGTTDGSNSEQNSTVSSSPSKPQGAKKSAEDNHTDTSNSSDNSSEKSKEGKSNTEENNDPWLDSLTPGQTFETEVDYYSLIDANNSFPKVSGRKFESEEELHAAMKEAYPEYTGTYSWAIAGKAIPAE